MGTTKPVTISKSSPSRVLEELQCLGYRVERSEVDIVTDGKQWSQELAAFLSGYLNHFYKIETNIRQPNTNSLGEYSSYRLVAAAHQVSQKVSLPTVKVYLTEAKLKLRVNSFDPIEDIFIDFSSVNYSHWSNFKGTYKRLASSLCAKKKKGILPMVCQMAYRTDHINLVANIASRVKRNYDQLKKESAGDTAANCSMTQSIRAKQKVVYHFDDVPKDKRVQARLKRGWTKLLKKFDKIGFSSVPAGKAWDVHIDNPHEVQIDHSTVKKNGYAPFIIKGDLMTLQLYPKNKSQGTLRVYVPLVITNDPAQPDTLVIDLSKWGLGKFSHIVESQNNKVVAHLGPNQNYGLVTNAVHPLFFASHKQYIDKLVQEIAQVETGWGFAPGSLVNIISVVPCASQNGEVRITNPSHRSCFKWCENETRLFQFEIIATRLEH